MTETEIHDKLKSVCIYPTGYRIWSQCSCGWISPECVSAHHDLALEEAESLLRDHQESYPIPTKGATDHDQSN
jgi:hypothetical protein